MGVPITPCDYARQRHANLAKWRHLWSVLVFAFGTSIVLFLIVAVFLFIRSSWLPGAVSTIGTMASGAAVKWVVTRRKEAVAEEKEAYEDVKTQCGADSKAVEEASRLAAAYDLF